MKSEIKSKIMIIIKTKWGNENHSEIEEKRESNNGTTNDNHKYQFLTPRKLSKMKKADTNKDFSLPKRFEILQDDIK